MRTRWKAASLTAVLLGGAAVAPAHAAVVPSRTLSGPGQVIRWSGAYPDPTGQGYNPATDATCTPASAGQDVCDIMTINVDVDLPADLKGPRNPAPPGFTKLQPYPVMPGDGLLVRVKWATDFDQWNLFVDGSSANPPNPECHGAAACGLDVDSNSQSVLLTPAAADIQNHHWKTTYTVKVGALYTDFDTSGIDRHYSGEASLFLDPSQRQPGTSPMLPVVHTQPPSNFHVGDVPPAPSNPTGWRYTPAGTFTGPLQNSCYLDERLQFGSTRCLRFDNVVRNVGQGPLSLEFDYNPSALATALNQFTDIAGANCHMRQELLHADATATFRDAGPCVFHTQHAHFHYQNFGRYQLFAVPADGDPRAIPVPPPGIASTKPVTVAAKVGFCTIDVENFSFGGPVSGQRPRTFSFPTCNVPNGYSAPGAPTDPPSPQYLGGAPEWMGISPGWGDIYTWDLPAQYLDISNVPDGRYEVVSTSNPDGGLLTADRSQETGVTCIDMRSNADGSAIVKVVEEFPARPNDAPLPACGVEATTTLAPPGLVGDTAGAVTPSLPTTSTARGPRPAGWALLLVLTAGTLVVAILAARGSASTRSRAT